MLVIAMTGVINVKVEGLAVILERMWLITAMIGGISDSGKC